MQEILPKYKLCALTCDITTLEVDAIVNAANTTLLGGGGVDEAIHRAAGPMLLEECKLLNGCPTGKAKYTKAYELPCKYIIHTVGPIYSGTKQDRILLSSCYEESMNIIKKLELQSVAFPAISCGVYGYPLNEAVSIATDTVYRCIQDNKSIQQIIFSCFDNGTTNLYLDKINSIT